MLNGSPVPIPGAAVPYRVCVITPNAVLLVGLLTLGLLKFTKFITLNISTRNSDCTRSVIGVCFSNEKSTVR